MFSLDLVEPVLSAYCEFEPPEGSQALFSGEVAGYTGVRGLLINDVSKDAEQGSK